MILCWRRLSVRQLLLRIRARNVLGPANYIFFVHGKMELPEANTQYDKENLIDMIAEARKNHINVDLFDMTVEEIFDEYMDLFRGVNSKGTSRYESKIWAPAREEVTEIFTNFLGDLEFKKHESYYEEKKRILEKLKEIFESNHGSKADPVAHHPVIKNPVANPRKSTRRTRRTRRARGTRRNRRNRRS